MLLYEPCLNGPGLTSYQIVSFSSEAVPPIVASSRLIAEAPGVRVHARFDERGCAGPARPAWGDRSSGAAVRVAARLRGSGATPRSDAVWQRRGARRSRPAPRLAP